MDNQQKFKPQSANVLYNDSRADRQWIPGTVAHGELHEDDFYYRGIVNGSWAETFPMPVDQALLDRGQNRFNIYCTPCHGYSGYGNGMIAQRADQLQQAGQPGMSWTPPKSLHDPVVRTRPPGHIFNTITNGIRNMPMYGPQIPVHDRWAIVAYVKALQLSQDQKLATLPSDRRSQLEASKPAVPPAAEPDAAAQGASAGDGKTSSDGSSGQPGDGASADSGSADAAQSAKSADGSGGAASGSAGNDTSKTEGSGK
jgi:mono/diheme cytochrome c family protein